MRILHLSDLHLTAPNTSFEDVWHGPSAVLRREFDFVVVSGDLSQRAGRHEYAELKAFAEGTLLDLLRKEHGRDRARVVFVPGNHDVDWGADIGDAVDVASLGARAGALLRRAHYDPEQAEYRHAIDDEGRLKVVRVDPRRYPSRFEAVQEFLRDFYDGRLGRAPHRPFELTSPREDDHWSAHVFPEAGVAFYGFNSCHLNDRYWTGARLSRKAVARARQHAERNAPGLLRVAVWHHGFESEPGRPDRLSLEDLGLLYNQGFRVGLHGHTHRAAADAFEKFFRERFVIVATGSIGAGPSERPDAIANQFSVVRVFPGQVDVEVFERDGATGVYEARAGGRRTYLLHDDEAEGSAFGRSWAEEHARTWYVDCTNGLAEVSVKLKALKLRGPLTLAVATPPYGRIEGDDEATTQTRSLRVAEVPLPDQRQRFVVSEGRGEYECFEWRYRASNSVALDRGDLAHFGQHEPWLPRLKEGEEARAHVVRFPCDRFAQAIEFESTAEGVVEPGSGRAIVERLVDEGGAERWVRVIKEEDRCKVRVEPECRAVRLEVESPVVGYRYTLVFRLARPGRRLSTNALRCAEDLVMLVRRESTSDHIIDTPARSRLSSRLVRAVEQALSGGALPAPGSPLAEAVQAAIAEGAPEPLSALLTRAVEQNLVAHVFGPSASERKAWLGPEGSWMGMLWFDERRQLVPAFGRFSLPSWRARFGAGEGVAGQAFRFGAPVFWSHDDQSIRSLIFQDRTPDNSPYLAPYRWLVAVPLVTLPGESPIGVVSFAGTHRQTPEASRLQALAQDLTRHGRAGARAQFEFLDKLQSVVNASFWGWVATYPWHASGHPEFARAVIEQLGVHVVGP
ncbi:MAG TPA: metallophosphoesterase [Polyangiaceae bacterium]|nr:metallophosphoesterase [Polyangiaceae bacterium]